MKKTIFTIFSLLLIIIYPTLLFGETENEGMDMKLYTRFLSFGLLVLIFLIFIVLIYNTSDPMVEEPSGEGVSVKILPDSFAGSIVKSNTSLAGEMKYINIIYYMVIGLIFVYLVIFFFTIF